MCYKFDIINSGDIVFNRISKKDFLNIKEEDVMFITYPGRMGDEDGSTFIVKVDNDYKIYRIDGWMYPKEDNKDNISMSEMADHFSKWKKSWKDKENNGKYTYIYMGFGNGLYVDNTIYNEYKPFLEKRVEQELKDESDKESLKYVTIYDVWMAAFEDMINNKKSL